MKQGISILVLFALMITETSKAQCCGGGAHMGGNIFLGTLGKGYMQVNTNYRYSYSAGYMQKDGPSDFSFVKNAYSNHVGLQLGYGITKKLTLDLESGYFLNRTQNFEFLNYSFSHVGYGLTSLTTALRFNIFKLEKSEIEWTGGIGVRTPLSRKRLYYNGVELSEDVQPNNGSYGLLLRSFLAKEFDGIEANVFLINSFSTNMKNDKDYREGNTFITTLLYAKKIVKNTMGILQLRNELRGYSYRYGSKVTSSGGYRLVIVPQINFTIKEKLNIGAIYELPIYRYYNGTQLKDVHALSINLNLMLPVTKNAKSSCEANSSSQH